MLKATAKCPILSLTWLMLIFTLKDHLIKFKKKNNTNIDSFHLSLRETAYASKCEATDGGREEYPEERKNRERSGWK